ncbi:hypothetical protein SLS56_005098 [Neofusicoccum ribis]|uniref:Uncharacterized protein n=1 Tax=Neofusicoccum ribis TaxID=45134 RepID=A0ABR3SWA5_9PEZI
MSFGTLPTGTWDVRFHGSCPRCHHWHNRMTLRLSRLPGVYNGVRCENCSYKWFGLGGNSTHTSLVSQQTRTLTFASDFSGRASSGPPIDGSAGAATLITRLHSMSAVGSPYLTTCTVPQRQDDNPDDQDHDDPRPTSRLRAHLSSSSGRDNKPLSKNSSRSSRGKKEPPRPSDQAGLALGPGSTHEEGIDTASEKRSISERLRAKLRDILSRLRRVKRRARRRASCHSMDTSRATTTENNRPLPISTKQPRHKDGQAQPSQQDQAVVPSPRSTGEPDVFVPRPPSRRQSAPEPRTSNSRSDNHGDGAYQKPFSYEKQPSDPGRDEQIRAIRRAKTMAAQQSRCECPVDCYCKRPTSSLIPDNPLTDRASLYHLDLAQPSLETRISRHSEDLAYIGSHLNFSQIPNISEPGLSMSSNGSVRGRSQSRRGRENLWRRSNATWESQATTAYTDSDAGSSTARRSTFARQDLLPVATSPRPRVPSPLASPTNINGFTEGEDHGRRSESVSSLDEDYQHSERATDGFPSVSPIQETASGGSAPVSMIFVDDDPVHDEDRLRISVDVPEEGEDNAQPNHINYGPSSHQPGGPLSSHPIP